ncbi:MAG TPA: FAD-dependent oxidoreductase, partial [Xanthomonadales bacterium]|nr:FAD-dependent oxidoreductase [Xanthomonadales bacterium]
MAEPTVWHRPGEILPPLEGAVDADVCVVGLGGAGLAAMTAALARGLSAIGVDAGQPGAGAAGRNGGFLIVGLASFHHEAAARFGRARATALYRA